MIKAALGTIACGVLLAISMPATAQLGGGNSCGGTSGGGFRIDDHGNGFKTTHYPNGQYTTTYSWTDSDGARHSVVVETGMSPPREVSVDC
ncbi:hypothetical protein [uncultured Sphingomonas sp.]|uniref:hypothetical protein n=1 Tax=uncultured Sphingomonas sp. TaxID=158754 RepID=UPI0025E4B669|nr:hypothetical protein [uncultured Sphingomonas sp.]